jgi:hypothetical protein
MLQVFGAIIGASSASGSEPARKPTDCTPLVESLAIGAPPPADELDAFLATGRK